MTAVSPSRTSSPERFSSFSLRRLLRARVLVDERGQRGAEALFVRAALVRVDRVRVGEDVLGVARRPLHRDLERDLAIGVLGLEVDDLFVDVVGLADAVEVLDVVDEAALVEEAVVALLQHDLPGLDLLLVRRRGTLVAQVDAQALVEERHLLEAGAQRLVLEVDGLEDRRRPARR